MQEKLKNAPPDEQEALLKKYFKLMELKRTLSKEMGITVHE